MGNQKRRKRASCTDVALAGFRCLDLPSFNTWKVDERRGGGGERHRKVGKCTDISTTKTWAGEMLTMEEDVDADSDACERATLVSKRGEEESM